MRWLEIIILRTAGNPEPPSRELEHFAGSLTAPGLEKAVLYNHAFIPGDLALALHWNTDEPRGRGSDLALGLVQELRRQGLIDHSVWITAEKRKKN